MAPPRRNWEGRASALLVLGIPLLWRFMDMKRLGDPNETHKLMLALLLLSDVLAIIAAVRHPRGWVFLLLPGGITLFIAFVVYVGAPF